MKKSLLLAIILITSYTFSQAQDCMGLTMETGASYEMTMYDGKDKQTGVMLYTIKNVRKEGGSTIVDVEMQMTSTKGKAMPANTAHYTCNGNEVIVDMSGLGGGAAAMKDTEVKIITNDITYSRMMKVGSKLKDGTLKTETYYNGSKLIDITISLTNRLVESKDNLTTPAGTFEAYKVSNDMSMESKTMGIPIRQMIHTVSYRNKDVLFDIKSESYDKNGKLVSYTVLSKVQ